MGAKYEKLIIIILQLCYQYVFFCVHSSLFLKFFKQKTHALCPQTLFSFDTRWSFVINLNELTAYPQCCDTLLVIYIFRTLKLVKNS